MEYYNKSTFFSIEHHTGNAPTSEEHLHDLYEFYYLKNGTASYLVNDKIYNLIKGDIVIIPPNTLHKTVFSKAQKRERILFYLDKKFITGDDGTKDIFPESYLFFHSTEHSRENMIFEDLLKESKSFNNEIYIKSLICELLILLQRSEQKNYVCSESRDFPEVVLKVMEYIASNYTLEVSLNKIATEFFVNPSYLSRIFKQSTGFSFCSYLNQYRIKEANKLLTETNMPITEIAFVCGFNSTNNFCKSYKKIMNTSPGAYRKSTNI